MTNRNIKQQILLSFVMINELNNDKWTKVWQEKMDD